MADTTTNPTAKAPATQAKTPDAKAPAPAPSVPVLADASDSDISWFRQPYGIMYGQDYNSYRESLKNQLAAVLADTNGSNDPAGFIGQAEQLMTQNESQRDFYPNMRTDPLEYRAPSVSDASVGGNDAINPYPAFCLDDDIVHGVFRTGYGDAFGMGRCYSEIYNSKQQILYLTMGVAKYRNLQTFLQNATRKELSDMNDNGTISVWSKVGDLLIGGLTLAIELPWLPIIWISRMINTIKDYRVTEYFFFRDTMPLYYRYVNTLLSHVAVSMGLWGEGNGANSVMTPFGSNVPEILKDGPDIYKIMCKRSRRLGKEVTYQSTDEMLKQTVGSQKYKCPPSDGSAASDAYDAALKPDNGKVTGLKPGVLANLWTGIQTGALEGANFVGFRIEKNDQASESFNNSTQESALLQKLNGEVQKARDRNIGEANGEGWLAKALQVGKKISSAKAALDNLLKGGVTETIAYLAAGNGYFDLPKQWGGSAGINRSLSFNMKLRAKTGGDNVSIFQSIMVPLCLLYAAALPRATGDSTYTSPFLVRAFCKGMYSIPAGIITTLSVSRGASEFGWSLNRLPTVVDVNFTIEDLSPIIFLGLTGSGSNIFQQAFLNNTKLHEYLSTLSGIGLKERYFQLNQLKRRFKAMALIQRNTTFSATYWGFMMGDSSLVRACMALTPWHRVPNN